MLWLVKLSTFPGSERVRCVLSKDIRFGAQARCFELLSEQDSGGIDVIEGLSERADLQAPGGRT